MGLEKGKRDQDDRPGVTPRVSPVGLHWPISGCGGGWMCGGSALQQDVEELVRTAAESCVSVCSSVGRKC